MTWRIACVLSVLLFTTPAWAQDAGKPTVILQGAGVRRLNAAPDDASSPNQITTGKETLEWTVPAIRSGLYLVELRTRTGNTDDDPVNIVTDYRLTAISADGKESASLRFEPKPGTTPQKTSKEWPVYTGDIITTTPLPISEGTRLHVSVSAPWVTIEELRLTPAPDRTRLAFRLGVAQPFALFRRGEPIQLKVIAQSFWDVPVKVPLRVELLSPYGKSLSQATYDLTLPANGTLEQPLTFDTPLNGSHLVRLHAICMPKGPAAFEYTQETPVGVVSVPTADKLPAASPFGLHPADPTSLYQSGFKWVRLWDSGDVWASHEREGKGKFDFRATDEKVDNFRRAGFEVIAPLAYTPTWASTHPEIPYYTGNGSPFPPKNIADWKDYCRAYMTRFKGRIQYYEVWNEPNTGNENTPNDGFFRGSVADYIALLKAAYEVSREVDPQIRILGCSGTGDFLAWTETVLAHGGGQYMDILSFHAYTTPSSPEEANLEGRLKQLHQIIQKHGLAKMPLWNTEVGYWQDRRIGARPATAEELLAKAPPGRAPNWTANWPYRPITEDDAAAFAVRHYYLNLAAGVEKLFWYSSSRTGFPLLCEDGSPRQICFAVAAASKELEGFTYWRRIDLGLRRLHLHLWRSGDVVKGIAWHADRGTRDIVFRSPISASAVDIWGNSLELPRNAEGTRLSAGRDPITITAPAEFFDLVRLQDRELIFPVDDAYVVYQVSADRPVKDHTSPPYHGDRRVFGLPDAGDALGWKVPGIVPGYYQIELELRTGYADDLYRDLHAYELTVVSGGTQTPVRLVAVDDPARRSKPINTKEGGGRAYGWARSAEPIRLDPGSEIHVTMKQGFGFVGSLALRESAGAEKPITLPTLAAAPTLDGDLGEVRQWRGMLGVAPLEIRHRRQVGIGVADPFASTSERDAWQGEKDLSAKLWAARSGDALYVAVDVTDSGGLFPAENGPFNGDCIELFLDLRDPPLLGAPSAGEGVYQLMLRAPKDGPETRVEWKPASGSKAVAKKSATGWTAEFLVPIAGLKAGRQLGLDVAIDDDDTGQGRKSQIIWHGTRDNFQDPSAYGRFVLP